MCIFVLPVRPRRVCSDSSKASITHFIAASIIFLFHLVLTTILRKTPDCVCSIHNCCVAVLIIFSNRTQQDEPIRREERPRTCFLPRVPLTPERLAGWLMLQPRNQFILITMGSAGSSPLIDWQVFAYTVCNKMSRPAEVATCVGCW